MTELDVTRTRTDRPLVERTGFRLSWGAIFAGMVVATVLQVVFSVLGLAIGFGVWDRGDGLGGYGVGAGIWLLVTALVTLFVGGLTTGRLAGVLTRGDGMLHGIVMWGLSALLAVWLVGSGAGAVLGGTFNLLGQTAAAATGGLVNVAGQATTAAIDNGDIDFGALQREVTSILEQSGVAALDPDSLQQAAQQVGGQATAGGASNEQLASDITTMVRERAGQVDRQAVINVITARTDLSEAEAEQLATRIESATSTAQRQLATAYDSVTERAGEVAATTTDALSAAAWWALLALGLSAGAAAWGAAMTARS